MASATVFSRNDPRVRTLLGCCLILCCGAFIVELIAFLFMQGLAGSSNGIAYQILEVRYVLFSMGNDSVATYVAIGFLLHAGIAALMGATLQRLWLRSWKLAASSVLLIFVAFEGTLIGLAMGSN